MDAHVEQQLTKLEETFAQFRPVLENMGRDPERLFRAVRDGYYEAALTIAGSIVEDMLRGIWKYEKISGKESKKTIEQLFAVIKNQVEIDRLVEDYIRDIQLARNRAAHGQEVLADDALETIRKLTVVLSWYAEAYLGSRGLAATDRAQRFATAAQGGVRGAVAPATQSAPETSASMPHATQPRPESTLELEVSQEFDRIKTCTLVRAGEEEETLRHYEEKHVDLSRIEAKCRDIVRLLNNANLRGSLGGENFAQLQKNGFALFEELLPHDTQRELATSSCENLIINIDDNLVHIPWELLFDGQAFLCRRYNVGRVVRTRQKIIKPRSRKMSLPARVLLLCDPLSDLKNAYAEGHQIRTELDTRSARVHTDLYNRRIDPEMLREEIRNYDIVHFAGHADYHPDDPGESGWLLENGKFTSRDILAMSQNLPLPALIFSNACQSGQTDAWSLDEGYERKIFGLAHAFLISGVQHYIGTFWEVLDEVSCAFSVCFYQHLVGGDSIGSAIRKARELLISRYGEDTIIWASYVLYGHPGYRYFAPGVEEAGRAAAGSDLQSTAEEPVIAGATRGRPMERRRATLLTLAAAVLVIAGFLGVFLARDMDFFKTRETVQPVTALAGKGNSETKDRALILKTLAERYKAQQQSMAAGKPADPWTSQPRTLCLLGNATNATLSDQQQTEQVLLSALSRELTSSGRVSVVERQQIDALLAELQLSTSEIADQDMALVMLGRLLGARLISVAQILTLKGATSVTLRVFETESSRIVISRNHELKQDAVTAAARDLAASLVHDVVELYPLQGRLARVVDGQAYLNIGARTGVRPGTRFVVLEGQEVRDPNGKLLGFDNKEIGLLTIASVESSLSSGPIPGGLTELKEGLRVRESAEGL